MWLVLCTSEVPGHQLGEDFFCYCNFTPTRTISPLIKLSKLLAPPLVSDVTNRKLYPWANLHPILSWNKEQLFSYLDMLKIKKGPLVFSADCKEWRGFIRISHRYMQMAAESSVLRHFYFWKYFDSDRVLSPLAGETQGSYLLQRKYNLFPGRLPKLQRI